MKWGGGGVQRGRSHQGTRVMYRSVDGVIGRGGCPFYQGLIKREHYISSIPDQGGGGEGGVDIATQTPGQGKDNLIRINHTLLSQP